MAYGIIDIGGQQVWPGYVGGFIHTDHLGSVAMASNGGDGGLTWREDYTPFGEARLDPSGNDDNPNFTGHIRDHDTGLVYAQARYYDPVIGRFLSTDPVGFAEGGPGYFNRYAYTMNDPVNNIDPDGRTPFVVAACAAVPACRGAAGATVGAIVGGGASLVNQTRDGRAGIDFGRVGTDALKGGAVGGVSATTLNPKAGIGTSAVLGGLDGGATAATDDDPQTGVVGGIIDGAVTDGVSAVIGGVAGRVAKVDVTSEIISTLAGATVLPQVNNMLGDPAGAAVDRSISNTGQLAGQIGDEINQAVENMSNGCFPPNCDP
ncbi:MAG: RHS repeat-associated core domain-containing protein [Pseudomonadota bacterium]